MAKLKILIYGKQISDLQLNDQSTYIAGRNENCDIPLKPEVGISRQHFKISNTEGIWKLEALSKFGKLLKEGEEIETIDLNSGDSFSVPPYDFQFFNETVDSESVPPMQSDENFAPTTTDENESLEPLENPSTSLVPFNSQDEFNGNEDATFIEPQAEGRPYIRFVDDQQNTKKVLRLEGNMWIGGRDPNCQIPIEDIKVSRKQFEIQEISNNFFIRDLGSVNGTHLNGNLVSTSESVQLKSGDLISVMNHNLYFEIRDPDFENRVNHIQPEVLATPPVVVIADPPSQQLISQTPSFPSNDTQVGKSIHQITYANQVNYPQAYTNTNYPIEYPGAPDAQMIQPWYKQKKNIIRMGMIGFVIILLSIVYLGGNKTKPPKVQPTAQINPNDPFTKLKPEQQTLVKQTYQLAYNLYIQGKYELAASEIQKIHELIPSYEDSKEILERCAQAVEIKKNLEEEERKRQQQLEIEEKVRSTIADCKSKIGTFSTSAQMESCLAPAKELDPENSEIQNLVLEVSKKEAERQRLEAERKDTQQKILRAKSMYAQAEELKNSGNLLGAIAAYNRFINSSLPDPDGLKSQAQRQIQAIQSEINKKIRDVLSESKKAQDSGNFRQAYDILESGKKINPNDSEIPSQQKKIKLEVAKKMRPLYQEGVLEESVGNIEIAKEKWKQIIDKDIVNGEFYQKAYKKLKTYGAM